MADLKKQQLVLAFVDFLNESIQDGTVKDDDKEGLEIASALSGSPHLTPLIHPFQSNASARPLA